MKQKNANKTIEKPFGWKTSCLSHYLKKRWHYKRMLHIEMPLISFDMTACWMLSSVTIKENSWPEMVWVYISCYSRQQE